MIIQEMKLRIMVVCDQYEPMIGGVVTVTRELAHGLAERGHAVALVVPSSGRRTRSITVERISVTYRGSLRWPWYEGMRLGCLSVSAARKLITSFAPDVAHIHSPVTLGVMARNGARRRQVPVVYTNHYLPANVRSPTAPRSQVFDNIFYHYVVGFSNRCSYVTAPSATALRLLHEHGLQVPSGVVSNGVDLRGYSPGPPDDRIRVRYGLAAGRPLVLSVGRLSSEKRLDVLLEAAARLAPASSGLRIAVAGTGPDEARLRARARRMGLAEVVQFLGFVPASDLTGLYRLADVFAITSEAELQSLTTMEAMATGLPVVAVDAYALGELVRHGENGLLARPGHAAEIAAHLDLLCSDPTLRSSMSAASLRIISGHERHRVLGEWESLYRTLAAAGAGRPLPSLRRPDRRMRTTRKDTP